MVTDPPTRLVVVLFLTMAVRVALTTAIPKLRIASEENRSHAEEEETKLGTAGTDQQPMVLKTEIPEREEPVFIEFSYSNENKNEQRQKANDPGRYSYNIDSQKANAEKLIPVVRVSDDAENPMLVKDTQESNEGADSILQWNVRRQTEVEENVPGFHNWPKHMPDHLRPISAFPDEESVIAKERSFIPGRQTKRDETFAPSEKFLPPPRAGPYLYPQSIIDREFRVPYY